MRYVVLHHTGFGDDHFDLMFERHPGGPLRTFRCPHWPPTVRQPLTPLPDHRRDYLEYEGPVSRGRGSVRRVDHGDFDAAIPAHGSGESLQLHSAVHEGGRIAIRIEAGDAGWTAAREAPPE